MRGRRRASSPGLCRRGPGGRAASGVSAKTTLVVASDKAGTKRAKAETLGIPIMTPEEFATLVAPLLEGR